MAQAFNILIGQWALGDERALYCSACEPMDPFC